ncbi:hypothetical protein D3C86_2077250 [compost metagenome]
MVRKVILPLMSAPSFTVVFVEVFVSVFVAESPPLVLSEPQPDSSMDITITMDIPDENNFFFNSFAPFHFC